MTSKTDTADQALTLGDRVQTDRVHTSLYTDPAIFEAEMDKIFSSTWVWVVKVMVEPFTSSTAETWVSATPMGQVAAIRSARVRQFQEPLHRPPAGHRRA